MNFILITVLRWILSLAIAGFILGSLFLVFWIIKPKWSKALRIQQPGNIEPIFGTELKRSILGLTLYMIPSTILYFTSQYYGYSPMYTDINEHGVFYIFFTFMTLVVLVDTWFYWAHRLMHWHPFFIKAHDIHHQSYNLNPLSAYSVDIVHGILNVVPYACVLLFMPWHPIAIVAFGLFSLFYNGYIHLGYDLPPAWFQKYFPFRLIYTASHHAIHHHDYDHNFSAYFTFWDKLMKTEKLPRVEKTN